MRGTPLYLLFLPALVAQTSRVDYMQDVHPILAARCFACHGGDKRSGGLSLSAYEDVLQGGRSGPAIMPGDAKGSLLMLRVTGENAPRMPLGGAPLTPREIAALTHWID